MVNEGGASQKQQAALMIAGDSLGAAFEDAELCPKLIELFKICSSIVVYRASPDDKARTVTKVMENDPNAFTLAIGDGANDVNMIQTANIGIGIMGKEGGQAATFSDFAVPNFKDLRRLLFWHGRRFGIHIMTFYAVILYAGQLQAGQVMLHNVVANWSGYHFYNQLYYALFHVLATWGICSLLLADQDVSLNKEKFVRDNQEPNHEAEGYDPNNWSNVGGGTCSIICSGRMWQREEVLKEKGVSTNSDGSTNNLAHYYWYCRDTVSNSFLLYMFLQIVWAWIAGFLTYWIAVNAFGDIINRDGETNDYANTALICVYINCLTHYLLIWMETKNWTYYNVILSVIGLALFMPIMTFLNNRRQLISYSNMQFSLFLGSPLFWFTLFPSLFITVLPRWLERVHEHLFRHPEFTLIKE